MAAAKKREKTKKAAGGGGSFTALVAALHAFDGILAIAVDRQARRLGPASLLDPWRGMHLDNADVQRLLNDGTHTSFFQTADAGVPALLAAPLRQSPRITAAEKGLRLTDIDLAALFISLAPDLDLRYERIFAYLQDDIARKRPTLDLIGNLLARDAGERLAVCARFASTAPLVRSGLIEPQGNAETPVLARGWRVDEMWRKWLVGDDDVGAELVGGAQFITPATPTLDQLPLEEETHALVRRAVAASAASHSPLRLLLQGPHGAGKFALAQAIGRELGQRLLVLDLRDHSDATELRAVMRRAQRAAMLFGAFLYVHGLSRMEQREPQLLRALIEMLAASPTGFMLVCASTLPPVHAAALPVLRIEVGYPQAAARQAIWLEALAARKLRVDAADQARLVARFSLNGSQIRQAVAEASAQALISNSSSLGYAELAAAARMQCGTELARLAQRIAPRADFNALVVPAEVLAQLREICARVCTRDRLGREWARGSVHARATGVTALFVGPSGTGKTLAAEAVARELGFDLYRIDLAGIVSKYIGETEKNLDRVFAAAEHANAVLFFDEADALFGKRSECKDAHDRYANIEIAYLLQKMEQFDGLAILATNLKQNLDEAFARRLTFTVTFPFPEEAERRKLWEHLWLPGAQRSADVDLAWFAREFRLSGSNIRNTVLAAAHLAAADGKIITREHLLHATRREFQKLGKNLLQSMGERRVG
jgi:MoxR-like ATPase